MELAVPDVVDRARGGLPDRPEAGGKKASFIITQPVTIVLTAPVAGLALVGLVLELGHPAVRGHDQVGPVRRGGVAVVFAVALHRAPSFREKSKFWQEIMHAAVNYLIILRGSQ